MLGGMGGVALLTTDAVWVRDGGSVVLGTFGFLCRGRFAGGGVGTAVSTAGHCIPSFTPDMGFSLLTDALLMFPIC